MNEESMTLYALRKSAAVTWLDETDPEWRSRFFSDWQRAEEFYRRPTRPSRPVVGGHSEPYEYAAKPDRDESDDGNFDTDLEPQQ